MSPLLFICCHGFSFRTFSGCLIYSELFAVIPLWQSLAFLPKTCMGNWARVAETAPSPPPVTREDHWKRDREEGEAENWKPLRMCLSTETHKNPKEKWAGFWQGSKGFTMKPALSVIGCLAQWEDTGRTHISKEDVRNHEQACVKLGIYFFSMTTYRHRTEAAAVGGIVCLTSL